MIEKFLMIESIDVEMHSDEATVDEAVVDVDARPWRNVDQWLGDDENFASRSDCEEILTSFRYCGHL